MHNSSVVSGKMMIYLQTALHVRKGFGHTPPQLKPDECFDMFGRWISKMALLEIKIQVHGLSSRLAKAMPSLIFTAVLEDNCTSRTCAICLEDYCVGHCWWNFCPLADHKSLR